MAYRPTSLRLPSRRMMALLAVAFVVAFGAIVVAADRGALPVAIKRLYAWPGGDKVGHVVLLAGLTLLLELALGGRRVGRGPRAPRLGSMLAAVAITAEEASQAFFPGRTLSLADLACSYLGVYLGGRAAAALLRRAATPTTETRAA
jgi:polysaccharide biosynthesis protein VpsQ